MPPVPMSPKSGLPSFLLLAFLSGDPELIFLVCALAVGSSKCRYLATRLSLVGARILMVYTSDLEPNFLARVFGPSFGMIEGAWSISCLPPFVFTYGSDGIEAVIGFLGISGCLFPSFFCNPCLMALS